MRPRTFLGGCVITVAAIGGCYTGGDVSMRDTSRPASSTTVDATEPGAGAIVGLACDVATILAAKCAECHGAKPSGGAPNRMMSYDDLMATSVADGKTSVAELTVARIKSKSPKLMMPPAGSLTASEIKTIEAWVAAGAPQGQCSDVAVTDPIYDTPAVCSSGARWTKGDRGSSLMRPGGACITCHDRDSGPSYTAAGTVYLTAHEPDDCFGDNSSETTKVVITDAKGKTYTATVNSAGNFYFASRTSPMEVPLRAKVVRGDKTRVMKDPAMHGDCNKCHTETGIEKTPGRVMAP